MVEREEEEEGKGVVESIKEPIEGLAEKVKEMVVGNGDEQMGESARCDVGFKY